MLLHPTRSLTYPELLIWYLSRPIFSPEEGASSNSTEIRPGGDPSGRVAGVGESSVLLDKLLDGSGDTVWTDGVKGGEDVVEVYGDDDVVGADNAAVGGCDSIAAMYRLRRSACTCRIWFCSFLALSASIFSRSFAMVSLN